MTVNLIRVGDQLVDLEAGDIDVGTLRVCIADDDTNLSLLVSINSSLSSIASSLSSIDSKLSTTNSSLSSISSSVSNSDAILSDCYISASHRLRTLAQAL